MRILITGVGGFIASHLATRMLRDGHEVTGVDDFSSGSRDRVPDGVELVTHDLSDPAVLGRLPGNCDLILHLAGQSSGEISFDDPVADLNKNTVSTLNLIRYGMSARASKLIYASSMSVYGSVPDKPIAEGQGCAPLSCYGVGKYASEQYLRIFSDKLPSVAMRMFNVYGPGQDMNNLRQGMVSIYLAQALRHGTVSVRGGLNRFRDFIYIDDMVEAWYRAAMRDTGDTRVLNVGTGQRTTVAQVLEAMRSFIPALTWQVEGGTPGDQSGIYADNSLMRRNLGEFEFTDLTAGLYAFAEWARTTMNGIQKGLGS